MIRSRVPLAGAAVLAAAVTLAAVSQAPARRLAAGHDHASHRHDVLAPAGAVRAAPATAKPAFAGRRAIEAAFAFESYRPGETATLRVWSDAGRATSLRIFHIGRSRLATAGDDELRGTPVTAPTLAPGLRAGSEIPVRVGDWPSGLYFAQLTAPGRVGFAPFVVAPRQLGENGVAVVLPTRTWQAQNQRDDDGDGRGDTWDATPGREHVQLGRPFEHRGVPPGFRRRDLAFLQWLHDTGRGVDVLAQEDLDEAAGAQLATAYDLLLFPGRHVYVTEAELDAVTAFRDLGGNLMFLSADSFAWRIDLDGSEMTRVTRWRALGRPEASLLGAQPAPSAARKWLLAGVDLPSLVGPGASGRLSYYATHKGARVFAAGTLELAASIRKPAAQRLLTNVWERLARTVKSPSGLRPMTPAENRRSAGPSALRGLAHLLPQYPALGLASEMERAESARLLAEMEQAAAPWVSPRAAARDGFDIRRPKRARGEDRVMWFHSEQRRSRRDDAYFDPRRPDTLIYADMPGYPLSLVGFMFSMPRGLEAGSPGGPITRWHWHVVCANAKQRGTKPRADGSCPRGTRLYGGSEMLHVWFTGHLRSAYAIHAPVPELCAAKRVPPAGCKLGRHEHGM